MRICLLFVLLYGAVMAAGQQHPNVERGFLPDKSYQLGDVDTINLFNGGVNVTIPLGQRYPVNGNLSYQFALSYATNGWEVGEHQYTDYVDYPPYHIERFNRWSYPARNMNAGFGWTLSFGRMFLPRPNPDPKWIYISPDGGQHEFAPVLHSNNAAEVSYSQTGNGPQSVRYSRDGTYLRLRTYADRFELDFPNGEVHTFDAEGKLTSMVDPFGNGMSISYGVRTGTYAGSPKWTITDTTSRIHYVYFRPAPSYAEEAYYVPEGHWRIDYVDLAAFDDSGVSNDGRAEYHLEYATDGDTEQPDSVLLSRRCPHSEPDLSETVRVAMLHAIQMPEGLRYEMTYDLGSQSFCSQMNLDDSGTASGNLTALKLTTGATIEFQYRMYDFPSAGGFEVPCCFGGDPAETTYFSFVPGIKSRIVKDVDGATVLSNTEYEPQWANQQAQKRVVRQKNGSSLVSEVHHHFTTCIVSTCGNIQEYGLPLTRVGMPASGPFLSTETYVPDAAGNLVLGRTSWLIYEFEGRPTLSDDPFAWSNRRVRYSKTVYEDGTYSDATYSSFDGLGHYRQTVSDGTVASENNQRTSFTNFNPTRGTYNVDANGAYSGNFSMMSVNDKWNLGLFDVQRATGNGKTSTVASCFNGNGFLTGRRVYAAFGQSPSLQGKDLLTIFTPTTNGNVSSEQSLGGDEGVQASTTVICPTTSTTENYRIQHRYASGVRKSSYLIDSNGSALSHFVVDTDIDANTGLVAARREASTVGSGGVSVGDGLQTNLKYDRLGRLVLETPSTQTNRGSQKRVVFSNNSTTVDVFEETADGTVVHRQTTMELDGLGRVKKETRTIPGPSATASRTWEFDGIGRLTAASAWGNQTPAVMTRFQYDPFGRVKTMTAPDGALTTYAYAGVRQSSTTSNVRTSLSSPQETAVTTTTDYDAEGRVYRVTDPDGIKTRYAYDVGGRLTQVCADEAAGCMQNRSFTYDNRGFLTGEQTPELGVSGNGTAAYLYDARGNVLQKTFGTSGAFDVRFEYDRAGRMKRTYEKETNRDLKIFNYGSVNAGTDYRNGRVTRAVRYNWLDSVGYNVQVIEDYTYAGREGRVSQRVTFDSECVGAAPACNVFMAGTAKRSFTQTFTYDELGAVTSATQPQCTIGDCANATLPARTVANTYEDGMLTSVSWTSAPQAASITYHDNGMVAKVIHANQVVDEILLDSTRTPRPYEIKTTNVVDPATCTPPTFTLQPQSVTISVNSSTSLTAKAEGQTGQNITYRWYRGAYPDSSVLVKTETLATGTVSTWSTPALSTTTSYWVKATNACTADGVASQTAAVTICTTPSVTSQPQGASITRSQDHTLSVSTSGTAPMTYQWFTVVGSTATSIPGATSNALVVAPNASTTYRVTVTNACGSVNSNTAVVTVFAPPAAPSTITATSNGTANTITWSASSSAVGIDYYEVERRDGAVYTADMPGTLAYTNGPSGVTPGTTYLYRVRGVDLNGVAGSWSQYDLTTTMVFSDDPLQPGTEIKGSHVAQLRQAIDAIRLQAGLQSAWTSYAAPTGLMYIGHVVEMRSRLNEARLALGLPAVQFAMPNLTPYGLVYAAYINELRNGVK